MTSLKEAFPVPAIYVNRYLWNSMKSIDSTLSTQYGSIVPFFPLADSRGGDAGWGEKPYVVYDMLMRFAPRRFYEVHKIQVFYFVRGPADEVLGWSNAISMILDRGDAAAQDINYYTASTDPTAGIYFHNLKVFQVDDVSQKRQDLSVRQYYTSSIIVEMEYHITRDNGFD